MGRIWKLPHHDVTHSYNTTLGDIKNETKYNGALQSSCRNIDERIREDE